MFMTRTISPTARFVRRLSTIATASVPSRQPPSRMTMPTPKPSSTPPKHTASSVSPVARARPEKSATDTEKTAMLKAALTVNPRPSFIPPKTRNGRLSTTFSTLSGRPVRWLAMMPTPMMPPSRIVLGTRNSSTANAAIAAPSASKKNSKTGCETLLFTRAPSQRPCTRAKIAKHRMNQAYYGVG